MMLIISIIRQGMMSWRGVGRRRRTILMMMMILIIRQGMMSCRGARRRKRRTILMMMMILMIRQGNELERSEEEDYTNDDDDIDDKTGE